MLAFFPSRRIRCVTRFVLGRKNCTSGPVRQAAASVPMPTVPPRKKPSATKNKSQPIRTQENGILLSLSDRMIAIRSLGPVPALLLMTIDIPADKITQPAIMLAARIAMEAPALIYPWNIQENRSMMGPPQKAQTTVPGLIYPLVDTAMTAIREHSTMT